IGRFLEIPETIEAIRRALQRERRDEDRRAGKLDHRIFPRERRVGERRGPPRDPRTDVPASLEPDLDDAVIELVEDDMEEVEETFVRGARPADPGDSAQR